MKNLTSSIIIYLNWKEFLFLNPQEGKLWRWWRIMITDIFIMIGSHIIIVCVQNWSKVWNFKWSQIYSLGRVFLPVFFFFRFASEGKFMTCLSKIDRIWFITFGKWIWGILFFYIFFDDGYNQTFIIILLMFF